MNNITKVKQLRTDYVQLWSVSRCLLLGEKKNYPQNVISLLSVFVFPTVNVFLESDRDGSWWKPFICLDEAGQEMEESLRAQRLRRTQNDILLGAWPPPTECDFEGTHSKISAKGPEFLATALRAIMVSGPSTVYHLVFTPYSPFLTVTRLKSFSTHGGGRFSIGSSQTITLLHAIDDACNDQWQACICHTRIIFQRSLANAIHYPLWRGWEPVAKSTKQSW